MSTPIVFFVPGTPAPGGSKTAYPMRYGDKSLIIRGRRIAKGKVWGMPIFSLVDAGGKANKAWRKATAAGGREVCKQQLSGQLLSGPLRVTFDFVMPRPKCHYGTGRNAAVLKASSPQYHVTKPDALKLARSTEDALTGAMWVDDCLIVSEGFCKRYAEHYETPGAYISVEALA